MGAALARFLQRAVPALKEQQKALEQLMNQDVIREQKLISLRQQKELIEQQVGTLTTELTAAQLLIEKHLHKAGFFKVGQFKSKSTGNALVLSFRTIW